jgi:hypothetical protein
MAAALAGQDLTSHKREVMRGHAASTLVVASLGTCHRWPCPQRARTDLEGVGSSEARIAELAWLPVQVEMDPLGSIVTGRGGEKVAQRTGSGAEG